jgi:hypothetical protein
MPGAPHPRRPIRRAPSSRWPGTRLLVYYQDNLDLLERLGAELRFFSPLRDDLAALQCGRGLPGGGYPELYARELEANASMRSALCGLPRKRICPSTRSAAGIFTFWKTWTIWRARRTPPAGSFPAGAHGHAARGPGILGLRHPGAEPGRSGGLAAHGGTCFQLRRGEELGDHKGSPRRNLRRTGGKPRGPFAPAGARAPILRMTAPRRPDSPPNLEGAAYRSAFGSFLHVHFAANPAFARASCKRPGPTRKSRSPAPRTRLLPIPAARANIARHGSSPPARGRQEGIP